MIKFFRKIRLELLNQNQMGKYFKYAIGEILLVVVGILIALQINNWNERRKENNLEYKYLIALKEEFKGNLDELDRVMRINSAAMANAQKLARHTGPDVPMISDKEFGKLFFGTINNDVQYQPGSGVVNEIINSGKLNLFKEPELKQALASLDGLLLDVRNQEINELGKVRSQITTLVQMSNVSSRKIVFDAYGGAFEVDEGKFNLSGLSLLNSVQFDNLLTQFIYTSGFMDVRYKRMQDEIKRIISILDNQINKR